MTPDTVDVVSTREFAATASQAWRAWSDPDFVTRWWGPAGFTSLSAQMDFRIGGTSLVCIRAPAGFGGWGGCSPRTSAPNHPFSRDGTEYKG